MLLMKNKNIKFVKSKEEINLDEVIMNIEFRESNNNQVRKTHAI